MQQLNASTPSSHAPLAHPEPPVPSRSAALEDRRLIELRELTGATTLPFDCAVSQALLQALAPSSPRVRIPRGASRPRQLGRPEASEAGGNGIEELGSLGRLVSSAACALRRAQRHYGPDFFRALHYGFTLDFSAPLAAGARGSAYRFARMHCGPDDAGEFRVTLTLPDEI